MEKSRRRVMIIGLDGAPPGLVFKRWSPVLPTLTGLRQRGVWSRLKSIYPPITVPAWASMVSGLDPGSLGCYGFKNRSDRSYEGATFPDSSLLSGKALWDYLSAEGRASVVIGVPPGYPARPLKGCQISCFMTPTGVNGWIQPPEMADVVEQIAGEYAFDVDGFRDMKPGGIVAAATEMAEKRFRVARYLAASVDWDLFLMVEIGTDRLQHALWHHMDERHLLYQPDSPYKDAIRNYYQYLDSEIQDLIRPYERESLVLIVSDHGAQAMQGGFRINEWLRHEGYLVLREELQGSRSLRMGEVEWAKTRAWATGGYCGRIHINLEGREPLGFVPPSCYEGLRMEIASRLDSLEGPEGSVIRGRALFPEQIYSDCCGIPPDLIVDIGDLRWRCLGSVGPGSLWTKGNDTGPDGANHSQHGIFIAAPPLGGASIQEGLSLGCVDILDIAPGILSYLGLGVPSCMRGRPEPWLSGCMEG